LGEKLGRKERKRREGRKSHIKPPVELQAQKISGQNIATDRTNEKTVDHRQTEKRERDIQREGGLWRILATRGWGCMCLANSKPAGKGGRGEKPTPTPQKKKRKRTEGN